MKIKISLSADTIEKSTTQDDREAAKKKRAILENMRALLADLREKFQDTTKAKEAATKVISDKMTLLKKRFNQIYKQLHGEEYYAVASSKSASLARRKCRGSNA